MKFLFFQNKDKTECRYYLMSDISMYTTINGLAKVVMKNGYVDAFSFDYVGTIIE